MRKSEKLGTGLAEGGLGLGLGGGLASWEKALPIPRLRGVRELGRG